MPWRSVGALLPLRVLGLTSLLDPSPLAKNLEQWIDWTALRSNLDDGRVEALAVAGTAIWTGRTVVFCDSCGHPPRHRSHVLDYVRCPVGVEHILASAAIPMLFPPVHISINMLHGSLVDPLIEDMRLLGNINTFFAGGAPGAHQYRQARGKPAYRQVPYIFVGPSRNAIGELAVEVFRSRYGGLKSVRSPDFALLNRLLGPGGAGRGELLSFVFFEPEFLAALSTMGAEDARRWLGHGQSADDPWRLEPLKAFTESDGRGDYRPSGTSTLDHAPRPW